MTSTTEILRAARKLIERPTAWTRKQYHNGNADDSIGTTATCFCAAGAIWCALELDPCTDDAYQPAIQLLAAAIGVETEGRVILWNDSPLRTHAEVLAAFDRAIELAEMEEQQ